MKIIFESEEEKKQILKIWAKEICPKDILALRGKKWCGNCDFGEKCEKCLENELETEVKK